MSWGGTMTCNIVNNTGGPITNLVFQHEWNGGVDMPIPGDQPVAPNAQIPVTIHVGDGGSDLWTVKFTDAAGNCWYYDEKQCDVKEEDFDSGKPVLFVLNPGDSGFVVQTPVSDSCTNSYDSCS